MSANLGEGVARGLARFFDRRSRSFQREVKESGQQALFEYFPPRGTGRYLDDIQYIWGVGMAATAVDGVVVTLVGADELRITHLGWHLVSRVNVPQMGAAGMRLSLMFNQKGVDGYERMWYPLCFNGVDFSQLTPVDIHVTAGTRIFWRFWNTVGINVDQILVRLRGEKIPSTVGKPRS